MRDYIMDLLSLNIIVTIFRYMTPILLASLGGLLSDISGVLNIGLEGLMLIGAFFAIMVNVLTGSWILGIIAAVFVCVSVSLLMGFCSMGLKVDILVAGFAVNIFGSGITILLMSKVFGVTGNFLPRNLNNIPTISIKAFENVTILDKVFNGHNLMVWVAFLATILCYIVLYYTPYGIYIRATGEDKEVALVNAISVKKVQYCALVMTGIFTAFAGAFLSTGITSMFVRDMTGGIGFLALAVVFFANRNPKLVFIGAFFFGLTSAITTIIQTTPNNKIPSQFIEIIPYTATIISLVAVALRKKYSNRIRLVK